VGVLAVQVFLFFPTDGLILLGKSGTSVTFFDSRQSSLLKFIEQQAKIILTRIGVPQTNDIIKATTTKLLGDIQKVEDEALLEYFKPIAKELLAHTEGDATLALCKVFAVMTGNTTHQKARSLLANIPGFVTVQVTCQSGFSVRSRGFVKRILAEALNMDETKLIAQDIRLTEDGGAVIDIPQETANLLLKESDSNSNGKSGRPQRHTWSKPSQLPPLKEEETWRNSTNGFSNGFSRGYSGGRFRGSSSRGGSSSRRGSHGGSRGGSRGGRGRGRSSY